MLVTAYLIIKSVVAYISLCQIKENQYNFYWRITGIAYKTQFSYQPKIKSDFVLGLFWPRKSIEFNFNRKTNNNWIYYYLL